MRSIFVYWYISKFIFTFINTSNNEQSNLITKGMAIKET